MNIKSGTIVWLQSGGPAMTAKHLNNNENLVCSWFVKDEIKEHYFTLEQLTDVNSDEPRSLSSEQYAEVLDIAGQNLLPKPELDKN